MTLINYARAIILGSILAATVGWWLWPAETNPCALLTRVGEGYIGVKPGPVGAVLTMDKSCPSQARWMRAEAK